MKKMFKNIFLTLAAFTVVSTSCIHDLDVIPLNKSDITPETAYGKDAQGYIQGLSKLYFSFINTKDLKVKDEGASELIRAFWSTQEVTTDACKCAWSSDEWVRALNTNTWASEQNDATYAIYCRTILGISYVNEYLRQTTPAKLAERGVDSALAAKVASYRAEARFIRACLYWMAFDTFGNVPFTTEDSPIGGGYLPTQKPRADVFDFCVNELKDIINSGDMPAVRSNYPRADVGSAYGLLARLYLNAKVYKGVPMYKEAKETCEAIFNLGYTLCPDYASLFRGDNGENLEARNEFLFAISYNAEKTQSYGGTGYLTFAAIAKADVKDDKGTSDDASDDVFFAPTGISDGWGGIRVPYEYVEKYFAPTSVPELDDKNQYKDNNYVIADKRGSMFNIKGCQESMQDALYVFKNGWSCWKYNNIPHDKTIDEYLETSKTKAYSDIDYPMIRLGEIYLIYAEACMYEGAASLALPKLKELADRAGVAAPESITQEFLVAERARELMWEGHRRTDLIRYGLYSGNDYIWPYKGSEGFTGQAFGQYMEIFSIPPTELASNGELVQNPQYPTNTAE